MTFTVADVADRIGGEVLGDGTVQLIGIAAAEQAREGDLTFADKAEYLTAAEQSAAAAVSCRGISPRRRNR
jgi:UDP-3-O-[3-hydroxymyristoyl] glucosamine N-acyltransferase